METFLIVLGCIGVVGLILSLMIGFTDIGLKSEILERFEGTGLDKEYQTMALTQQQMDAISDAVAEILRKDILEATEIVMKQAVKREVKGGGEG